MRHKFHYFAILILTFSLIISKNSLGENFIPNDAIDPYCDGADVESFLVERKIRNIEIKPNKARKWIRNAFRAVLEFNSNQYKTENDGVFTYRIKDKFKKKFKSKLIVNFKEKNLSCKFNAKIRMTGDIWVHLDWKKGTPLTSIQVELLNGHINYITKFKLFIPKSREGGNNEIFISSFLRELGFLAPRTFMVPVKINGISENYIFQEDLRKEFLENSKLVEGPLLEGDERFSFMTEGDDRVGRKLSLSRIINKNFSFKNKTNQKTALTAVANLNLIYLQHHQIEASEEGNYLPVDRLHINTKKFLKNRINKEKFQTYEALIYSFDAHHSLSNDDRRFYFDPIYQNYQPIYYDGKSNILNKEPKSKRNALSRRVSIDAKNGAINAIKLINNMDHKKYRKKLLNLGIYISENNYKKIKERILKRLKIINFSDPLPVKFKKTKKYFSEINNNLVKNRKLVFVDYKKKEFYFCSFDQNTCNKNKVSKVQFDNYLAEILSQRFINKNELNLINSEYLFIYDNLDYENGEIKNDYTWKVKNIDDKFIIKYNSEMIVSVIEEKKQIKIEQSSNVGRAIITGEKIKDWSIFFNGSNKEINSNFTSDYLKLSGCLTFLDIEVENINLLSIDSPCEDSINFVRVNGNVKNVNIEKSISDSLDLDFSNVKIDFISIKSSGNDCLDLSNGIYRINNISIENCGDKAISAGERSDVFFQKIKIKKSNIGVAAKDSSIVEINKSEIYESPICFSAYRKKQEFSGAMIKVNKTNCERNQFFNQKGSKIILGS